MNLQDNIENDDLRSPEAEDADAESGPALRGRPAYHETAEKQERAILVGVSRPPAQRHFETDEHVEELELLTQTAGAIVVEKVFQNRDAIDAATFIGKGKVEYLRQRCEDIDVQAVIFDDDLSPVQQRNLERMIDRKVIDRTTLILDIFARHARTNTAKTQVELAQLEYLLPRLSGMWTHLSKQYGGIRTKGPGETQIETDRRMIRVRISHLKAKLERIDRQRITQRKGRKGVVRVALVGYTNAGKSTLLNILTGAGVLTEDKLFATLDSTVRALELGRNTVLLTDTVGFIRKLPPKLIASFRSTLEEIVEADILLHVVDIAHPSFKEQIDVVNLTLKEIRADGKPTITVFNKIDAIEDKGTMAGLRGSYPNPVFISASRGINLGDLIETLRAIVEERTAVRTFRIHPPDFKIAAEFHRVCEVLEEHFGDEEITIRCTVEPEMVQMLVKRFEGKILEIG